MVPLCDGPRQEVIDLGVPDPGPLGSGAYTGPLLTKTLLFLGLRERRSVPHLDFRTAADRPVSARTLSTTPTLLGFDKATSDTIHAVELTRYGIDHGSSGDRANVQTATMPGDLRIDQADVAAVR